MSLTTFTTTTTFRSVRFEEVLHADPQHPHVQLVDMPFRVTSTWHDRGCEVGVWEKGNKLVAWAVFQPPWHNLDYAIVPSERGSALEADIFAWGTAQMRAYAQRTGTAFHGTVEFFEDTPKLEHTVDHLVARGFQPLDWSVVRFERAVQHAVPPAQLPAGYRIRPLHGTPAVRAYVALVEAVFGLQWMTPAWRMRTLAHPAYHAALDLVVATADDSLVGFCSCWRWHDRAQIEPLGVHPAYQGIGLGRALEHAACAAVQQYGARVLYVDHGSTNATAIALSQKVGFRQRNTALKYALYTHPEA
jgi:ribosomal protein S18 acetylase RimI-like enzyme